jgi:hypothetical protein
LCIPFQISTGGRYLTNLGKIGSDRFSTAALNRRYDDVLSKESVLRKGTMQLHGISETQIHREVSAHMGQKFTDHATTVIHAELENGLLDYIKECTVCSSTLTKIKYRSNCLVPKFGDVLATEVYLFPLMRELIGKIGLKTLMGRDFVTKNPEFLRDLWDLDSRVFQLLLGVDILPLPKYRSAREPRDRILRAVTEHHQALFNN